MTEPLKRSALGAPMPFEVWPAADREAWTAAQQPGSLFLDPGGGAHWRPPTRAGCQAAYGRWLAFLLRRGWLDPDLPPAARVDRSRVLAYIEELQARLKPISVWSYLSHLHNVLRALAPAEDWSWLRDLVNRLHRKLPRGSVPVESLLEIEALYRGGLDLVAHAGARRTNQALQASIDVRDGTTIAFQAAALLRRRNLAQIRLGGELIRTEDGYALVFEPEAVKNNAVIEGSLPPALTAVLDLYIEEHRPRLLQGHETDLLWIAATGQPFDATHLGMRVAEVTRRLLGKPVPPHRFRHCAATSLATASPELARLIRPLLAHKSNRTGEVYYNRATMIDASRRHGAALAELRRQLIQEMEMRP